MSLWMIDQRARLPVLTFDAGMGKVAVWCSNHGKGGVLPLTRLDPQQAGQIRNGSPLAYYAGSSRKYNTASAGIPRTRPLPRCYAPGARPSRVWL